jgi:16S rRNA (adenine1518-N6/adenine1519-N6)-dimethyltransferase
MTTPSDVPAWEDPRKTLARHGVRPKKRFSQSILVVRPKVEAIVAALEVTEDEPVIELGPGPGTLTGELLRRGARVVAVERDREMIAILEAELGACARLRVVEGDAAAFDPEMLTERSPVRVVGNLPYAITGRILRRTVEVARTIAVAVFMVQREVRDRLLAVPGTKAYGALTVFTTAAFDVEPIVHVPAGCFYPAPKVDSAVVRLRPRTTRRAIEDDAFRSIVRVAFDARRKQLRNALGLLDLDATMRNEILERAAIDGSRRGETLSVEEFALLASAYDRARRPSEDRGH